MENKQRVKNLMNDRKKRKISDVAEELDINPTIVHGIFMELDSEGYWDEKDSHNTGSGKQ